MSEYNNIYSTNYNNAHYKVGSLIYYHIFSPPFDDINQFNLSQHTYNFSIIFYLAFSLTLISSIANYVPANNTL